MKTQPAPSSASTGPATGPITLDPNCIIVASVIALSSAAPLTVLASSAAWAGISPERMIPETSVIANRLHRSRLPVNAKMARISAIRPAPTRQMITTRPRSYRSASAPPKGANTQGPIAAKVTSPLAHAASVSSKANQPRAVSIAQSETAERPAA